MQRYPARFEEAPEGGFTVTFRDIPEAITQGDDIEEARAAAVDALVTAMDFYFEDRRPVPAPSAAHDGEELVALPVSVAAKVLLLNEMLATKTRPIELAKAMAVRPQEVTRLLDLHHATKIDTLAQAFAAIGLRLDVTVS
ncbi:MAG: type II toxin-antitoxin system HicB family antitoxin [Rhizobacter sp.]